VEALRQRRAALSAAAAAAAAASVSCLCTVAEQRETNWRREGDSGANANVHRRIVDGLRPRGRGCHIHNIAGI